MRPALRSPSRQLGILLGSAVALVAAALGFGRGASLPRADCAFVNGVEPATLDPAAITAIPEGRIVRALFEGLVVRDPRTLEPRPGMAESWERSEDGFAWRFSIREGARWSNGDPVTAEDFARSFERLLDPRTAAPYASKLFVVRGAQAFATDVGADGAPRRSFQTVGIRAEGSVLAIDLDRPFPGLLDLLACPQFSPVNVAAIEACLRSNPDDGRARWLRPENLVTNGPFRLLERRTGDRIRLGKSATYWDRDHVAFETIDALSTEHLSTVVNLYLSGEVAWVDQMPAELLPRLARREDFRSAPYLGTYFYRVNVTRPPFDDPRVRRALALAIDREEIVRRLLGANEAPLYACVPPAMRTATPGWSSREMRHGPSFDDDVREARRLLAEAGYGEGGRAFPSFAIHYNTRESHRDIAEVVADGWRRNLGIRARLENQEWRVFLDTQRRGDYDVSRSSWIADGVDPQGFLEIFTSGDDNNRTGWSDARFDAAIARASAAEEPERSRILGEAEAILLDALPILPIYAYATRNLVDPRLGGFFENALDEHSPKSWYWMDDAELAAERGASPRSREPVESHGPREGLHAPAGRRRDSG